LPEPLQDLAFTRGQRGFRRRRGCFFHDDEEAAALRMARKLESQEGISSPKGWQIGGTVLASKARYVTRDRGR
jgi:hypothetical protein